MGSVVIRRTCAMHINCITSDVAWKPTSCNCSSTPCEMPSTLRLSTKTGVPHLHRMVSGLNSMLYAMRSGENLVWRRLWTYQLQSRRWLRSRCASRRKPPCLTMPFGARLNSQRCLHQYFHLQRRPPQARHPHHLQPWRPLHSELVPKRH